MLKKYVGMGVGILLYIFGQSRWLLSTEIVLKMVLDFMSFPESA